MSFNLNNHINQPIIKRMYLEKVGTKWVHSGYNDSGILKNSRNEKALIQLVLRLLSAGPTRLELATSCVTGRRSNQLNYDRGFL